MVRFENRRSGRDPLRIRCCGRNSISEVAQARSCLRRRTAGGGIGPRPADSPAQAMPPVRVGQGDAPPGVLAAMLIGYARVSTIDQNPALQLDALQAAGVERLYADRASGLVERCPELQRALDALRQGDTLVCWRLDRLGRSVAHLLRLAEGLRNRGVELRSLIEGIDTSTPAGEAYMTIIAAMAQMERRLLSERTKAGGARGAGARPASSPTRKTSGPRTACCGRGA